MELIQTFSNLTRGPAVNRNLFLFCACFVAVSFCGRWVIAEELKPPAVLPFEGEPSEWAAADIAFSPDGKMLAASWLFGLYLYDANSGKPHALGTSPGTMLNLQYLPGGKALFGSHNRLVPIFDAASGKTLNTLKVDEWNELRLLASPRGDEYVIINTDDQAETEPVRIRVFDIKTGQESRSGVFKYKSTNAAVIEPTAGKLMAVSCNGGICLVNMADLSMAKELGFGEEVDHGTPQALAFSPDGKYLAATYFHGTAKVWDIAKGDIVEDYVEDGLYDEERSYRCIAFSPDGKLIAVGGGSRDGEGEPFLGLASATTGDLVADLSSQLKGHVRHVAFNPNGKQLAATSIGESAVRVWDVSSLTGEPVRPDSGGSTTDIREPPAEPAANKAREWTSADGRFTINAELIKQSEAAIRLKKADGSIITVPKSKLSAADRVYLESLGD